MKPRLLAGGPATGGSLVDAIAEIEAASCSDEAASAARREMLAFVDTHPDALHRSCAEAHLTGSAIVIDDSRQRTLLMLHAKIGKWLQPGGHADGEGHLGTVALTEAAEETGIEGLRLARPAVDCDVHVIPARSTEPEHRHLDVRYVVLAPPDPVVVGNHESHELRWVTLPELEALARDRSLVRLARAGFDAARAL